jgi:hypothetical protein
VTQDTDPAKMVYSVALAALSIKLLGGADVSWLVGIVGAGAR